MAIVTRNIITQGLSGKLGNLIVFRQRAGKTIVSVKPDRSNVQLSDKQQQQNRKFQGAVAYARHIIQDETAKAAYDARAKKGQTAYHVAIAEYIHQTQVEETAPPATDDTQGQQDATTGKSNIRQSTPLPKEIETIELENRRPLQHTGSATDIKKVPLPQTTVSTAKQRQQSGETTGKEQGLKTGKVQK